MNKLLRTLLDAVIENEDDDKDDGIPYICQRCRKEFDYGEENSDFMFRWSGILDDGGGTPSLDEYWDDGPLCADCASDDVEESIEESKQYQDKEEDW